VRGTIAAQQRHAAHGKRAAFQMKAKAVGVAPAVPDSERWALRGGS